MVSDRPNMTLEMMAYELVYSGGVMWSMSKVLDQVKSCENALGSWSWACTLYFIAIKNTMNRGSTIALRSAAIVEKVDDNVEKFFARGLGSGAAASRV